eukprot:3156928-Amphidinium_carterae.1
MLRSWGAWCPGRVTKLAGTIATVSFQAPPAVISQSSPNADVHHPTPSLGPRSLAKECEAIVWVDCFNLQVGMDSVSGTRGRTRVSKFMATEQTWNK